MKQIVFFLLLSIVLFSCKDEQPVKEKVSIFDSAMHVYLEEEFADYYQDTIGYECDGRFYQHFLHAYYKKDTSYVRAYLYELEKFKQRQKKQDSLNQYPCPELTDIFTYNSRTTYRVIYEKAFCPYAITFTIFSNDTDKHLEIAICANEYRLEGLDNIYPLFAKDTTYTITIADKDWDDFIKEIHYVDYWGMKPSNGDYGVDGSDLTIIGVEYPYHISMGDKRAHRIHRWAPERAAIYELYRKLYKLSKLPTDNCLAPDN